MVNPSRKQNGLTLPELIITVIVLSILAGLAAPAFTDFLKNERIVAAANEFLASFYLARTEAIKRNRRVTICKTLNPQPDPPGVPTCDDAANWESGYLVFTDGNPQAVPPIDANALYEPAAPDNEVLIKVGAPLRNMTLRPNAADIDRYVSYVSRGLLRKTVAEGGDPQNGSFRLCDDRGSGKMRAIVLTALGRARILAEEAAADQAGGCP